MYPQARLRQAIRPGLGKLISEFGERLAISAPERVDATIVEGLNAIVALVDADRMCWYEVEEESANLVQKYSATARQAPHLPRSFRPGKCRISRNF